MNTVMHILIIGCTLILESGLSIHKITHQNTQNPQHSSYFFETRDLSNEKLKVFGLIEMSDMAHSQISDISNIRKLRIERIQIEKDTIRNYVNLSLSYPWSYKRRNFFIKDKETFLQEEFENEGFYGVVFKNTELQTTMILFVIKNQKEDLQRNIKIFEEIICLK